MKFIIIIPAHNEELYIGKCLESLENQTFRDFICIIVNDNSIDKTQEILENFISKNVENKNQWKIINRYNDNDYHQPGAKVIETFNFGLKTEDINNFDIICKFDADIVFPNHYLEKINEVYENNPNIGMVSGLVYIQKNNKWQFENISSKNHIRGPIKSYRISCFKAMKGLRPVLGWDNIDVMLAQMYGYKILSIKSLWVKHLRPTAYKYKHQKAKKLGEYFYNIGLDFPLAFISSLKYFIKNKSFLEFLIINKSFLEQKEPKCLSNEEILFIRKLRYKEISRKIKNKLS